MGMVDRDSALIVVAIGGNALQGPGGGAGAGEWFAALERNLPPLVDLVAKGSRLVLSHGNGPQVGDELRRMELARRVIPPLSLDICGAETQGSLGYAIQQVMGNLLRARGLSNPVAALVTQVVVDPKDPAFRNPSKPIGPFYGKIIARRYSREQAWHVTEDAGRGWRRVVPSPRPIRVVEAPLIRCFVEAGGIPITVGGGGIPVVEEAGRLRGVEAVVEKDRATAVIATALGADRLIFATGVERVALDFGLATQRFLDRMTVAEARAHLAAGAFPPGSMGPKVEAAIQFIEEGGRVAIITSLPLIGAAVRDAAGTRIVAGG
jgi:carbamate kinase